MELKKFEGLVYDKETEVLGVLVSINYLTGEAVVITEDGEWVSDVENLEILDKITDIDGDTIINRDVFVAVGEFAVETGSDIDKMWEIELLENGEVVLHLLDKELNRVKTGESFDKELLRLYVPSALTVLGNIHELELEEEKTVDFNITVVRQVVDGKLEYLYACNNKAKEEVDLISVIFVGSTLLEEEDYERTTVTHEEYLEYIDTGLITEVSPRELQNYVTGLMFGLKNDDTEDEEICGVNCGCAMPCEDLIEAIEDSAEEEEEGDCNCDYCVAEANGDYCDECGDFHEDCKCNE